MVLDSHPQVQPAMLARRGMESNSLLGAIHALGGSSRFGPKLIVAAHYAALDELTKGTKAECVPVRSKNGLVILASPPLASPRAGAMTGTYR